MNSRGAKNPERLCASPPYIPAPIVLAEALRHPAKARCEERNDALQCQPTLRARSIVLRPPRPPQSDTAFAARPARTQADSLGDNPLNANVQRATSSSSGETPSRAERKPEPSNDPLETLRHPSSPVPALEEWVTPLPPEQVEARVPCFGLRRSSLFEPDAFHLLVFGTGAPCTPATPPKSGDRIPF